MIDATAERDDVTAYGLAPLWEIRGGDVRDVLKSLPSASVNCIVTSPPYWGLRDYGTATWEGGDPDCDHRGPPLASPKTGLRNDGREHDGLYDGEKKAVNGVPFRGVCGKCGARRVDRQIGLESSVDAYVANLVGVFEEARRVLTKDGSLWLNLGDSYAATNGSGGQGATGQRANRRFTARTQTKIAPGLKPKDLVGVPWRVAFALQAAGWYLRASIVWAKPNPMPESVTDRPTRSHELVFLLTKSPRYYFDAQAIAEPVTESTVKRLSQPTLQTQMGGAKAEAYALRAPGKKHIDRTVPEILKSQVGIETRNARDVWRIDEDEYAEFLAWKAAKSAEPQALDVWTISPEPFAGKHFATFPTELARRCIVAGSPPSGVVLDVFAGSGTTLLTALNEGRRALGIEINPEYVELARARIIGDKPLLNATTEGRIV